MMIKRGLPPLIEIIILLVFVVFRIRVIYGVVVRLIFVLVKSVLVFDRVPLKSRRLISIWHKQNQRVELGCMKDMNRVNRNMLTPSSYAISSSFQFASRALIK
jgi:hypothetical protein